MLRVGILGVRGYTGEELIRILLRHSQVKISYLTARLDRPVPIAEIFPQFKGRLDLYCDNLNLTKAVQSADLFFLALPHTSSMDVVPTLLRGGKKVIDLSADYRLDDYRLYEAWYKVKHKDKANIKKAVYGLSEINNSKIKKAGFIANPGCYPTAAILALAPLLKEKFSPREIIIDAKSGYSGAGRRPADDPFWAELKDNFKAYKVDAHQHTPEIEQELFKMAEKKIKVTFVPHLLPIERGILETIYVKVSHQPCLAGRQASAISHQLTNAYKKYYKDKPLVRIKNEGEFPCLRDVQGTSFCDIGVKVSADQKTIIIISAIDNLLKGASGQAVQNMNLMCGFEETEGLLRNPPLNKGGHRRWRGKRGEV